MIAFVFLLCFVFTARAQTVEHIVKQNIAARGGLQQIEKVHSIQMSGYATMNGMNAPFTIMMERPGKLRIDLHMQNNTIVQAYDGNIGWARIPDGNGSIVRQMSPSEAQSLKDEADFDGPLIHYKQKGNKVVLLGRVMSNGIDSYKLLVTNPKGEKTTMLVNARSYNITGEITHKKVTGSNPVSSHMAKIETNYSDFKHVRDLVLPFAIETVVDGKRISDLKINNIQLNPDFPDSLFTMPAK
ncbi:MAG TPA: hypothetical protein VKA08_01910 [Balneolales bacterium]|nr:hypothetical protein [Balneolales bacterium]